MLAPKHYLRPATILQDADPATHTVRIRYLDRTETKDFICDINHPFAGPGWGMFVMPTRGTRVMVDTGSQEKPFIVSTSPLAAYIDTDFSNRSEVANVGVDENAYPKIRSGEIALQSIGGSKLYLNKDGDVKIYFGSSIIEYTDADIATELFDSKYTNTEAGRYISGIVKRDRRTKPKDVEEKLDKLTTARFDKVLAPIGKNPQYPVSLKTLDFNTKHESLRNPPLVETRSLIYEFSRTSMFEDYAHEVERFSGVEEDAKKRQFLNQPNRRDQLRTDVLNLGLHLPNSLIEKIEGTVVDIYGNILDVNRNRIDFSKVDTKDAHEKMQMEAKLLRRSIKYHFEINARKETLKEQSRDILDSIPPASSSKKADDALATGYSHSRLSIDIDGEGLTKINIPASSNCGNIPLLSRYINNSDANDRNSASYRNKDRVDIAHMAFGKTETDGIKVLDVYAPDNTVSGGGKFQYRTAYHSILTTASKIIQEMNEEFIEANIDNAIESPDANAGGRSLHLNLDGSMDLNVGRDTIDGKSVIVDTAGSVISRIGKDFKKNSVVSQLDGNVKIQVGGDTVRGEDELTFNNVAFFVKALGGAYHKVEVNDKGIFFTSAANTNIVFDSQNNLVLKAIGQVLLSGATVSLYGDYSENGDTISGQRLVEPNGTVMK